MTTRNQPERTFAGGDEMAEVEPRIAHVRLLEFPGSINQWQIVCCPYCGGQHHHGAGYSGLENPRDYLGHRAAHCATGGNNGYYLVEKPTTLTDDG